MWQGVYDGNCNVCPTLSPFMWQGMYDGNCNVCPTLSPFRWQGMYDDNSNVCTTLSSFRWQGMYDFDYLSNEPKKVILKYTNLKLMLTTVIFVISVIIINIRN